MGPHWFQKNLPANGTHYISQIDQSYSMEKMKNSRSLPQPTPFLPKRRPVKLAPMPKLDVYENGKNRQPNSIKQNLFLIHRKGICRGLAGKTSARRNQLMPRYTRWA